jgi:hypothetical protein
LVPTMVSSYDADNHMGDNNPNHSHYTCETDMTCWSRKGKEKTGWLKLPSSDEEVEQ